MFSGGEGTRVERPSPTGSVSVLGGVLDFELAGEFLLEIFSVFHGFM